MFSIFVLTITVLLSLDSTATVQNSIVPAFWCLDSSPAEKSGVLSQCQSYNKTMFNQKFNVTFVYLVGCGPSNIFINDTLKHVLTYVADIINLEFWPYDGPEDYQAKAHSCVINQLKDVKIWFPFIRCLALQLLAEKEFNESLSFCFKDQKIEKSTQENILDCAGGPLGEQLQKETVAKADAAKPDKPFLFPWTILNDFSSAKGIVAYQWNLVGLLCASYSGDQPPKTCQIHRSFTMLPQKGDQQNCN